MALWLPLQGEPSAFGTAHLCVKRQVRIVHSPTFQRLQNETLLPFIVVSLTHEGSQPSVVGEPRFLPPDLSPRLPLPLPESLPPRLPPLGPPLGAREGRLGFPPPLLESVRGA